MASPENNSKRIIITYLIAGLIAVLSLIFGLSQKKEADKQKQLAEKSLELAERSTKEAEAQERDCAATRLKLDAVQQELSLLKKMNPELN